MFRFAFGWSFIIAAVIVVSVAQPTQDVEEVTPFAWTLLLLSVAGISLLLTCSNETRRDFEIKLLDFLERTAPAARKILWITGGLLLTALLTYWAIVAPEPQRFIAGILAIAVILITFWHSLKSAIRVIWEEARIRDEAENKKNGLELPWPDSK